MGSRYEFATIYCHRIDFAKKIYNKLVVPLELYIKLSVGRNFLYIMLFRTIIEWWD